MPTPRSAADYIATFRRGEGFNPPSTGLVVDGQPDPAALQLFGVELAVGESDARESIVQLLVDLALRTDPLTARGAEVVRHPGILALLAGPALLKPDLGRDAAVEQLRKRAMAADLVVHEENLARVLAEQPTPDLFLLLAKARPQKSKDAVERIANSALWRNREAARIARAALGDREIEDQYLNALAAAKDGKALVAALAPAALIGSPRSLKAIAEQLRTPLTIEISGHAPGKHVKSVRLDVLVALVYNRPDAPGLYPNNINRDEDYRAAERYCEQNLGAVYERAAPPFLKYATVPAGSP